MTVAIIDYGSGNLHSAAKAFERAARSMEDPQAIKVTRDPDAVYRADRIVLPGVGAFADCRRGVDAVDGMLEALTEAVRVKARPFFGELVDFMTSGPVVVQVLEGEGAILKYRDVMGATDPSKAAEGTIRKLYAKSIGENSVHGSDAPETAVIEIAQFFAGNEIVG